MGDQDESIAATAVDGAVAAPRTSKARFGPGDIIAERYEVQSVIGAGAMGEVYRVNDRELNEVVALKRMTLLASDDAIERFRREVRLARKVTHRNVARTHDLGTFEGTPFLTMELIDGKSLEDILEERGKLAPEFAVPIARDILGGLGAAHDAGVVHRDLKPANVLVARDGRVVLTDFGIARQEGGQSEKLTQAAQIVGTPLYMAPEQVTGAPIDARTDFFAFGVMFFEMLTGDLPFDGPTAVAVAMARLVEEPRALLELAPEVPQSLALLTRACLAKDADDRPASAGAIGADLGRWREGAPGLSIPPMAPLPTRAPVLAVLPFGYRGPPDENYLGDAIAEELVDVLSRTAGLRVMAFGASAKLGAGADPQEAGRALGANLVVSGTVHSRGDQLRISTRLIETETREQRWSQRFNGKLEDVFELQEQLSQRIAEALRLEASTIAHGKVPPEALTLYFRARRSLTSDGYAANVDETSDLERCVQLAPNFAPAHSLLAVTRVRDWFVGNIDAPVDLRSLAQEAVERAVALAPKEPDTQLARAMFSVQEVDYAQAVQSLHGTLELAPTHPIAHYYLGSLQMEAGQPHEAEARLKLAIELDPSLTGVAGFALARITLMDNRPAEAERWLETVRASGVGDGIPYLVTKVRLSSWQRDFAAIRRVQTQLGSDQGIRMIALKMFVDYLLGTNAAEPTDLAFDHLYERLDNVRFRSLFSQILCEAHCLRGEISRALRRLDQLIEWGLLDVDWLERCPLLEPIRAHADYPRRHAATDQRASEVRTHRAYRDDAMGTWS